MNEELAYYNTLSAATDPGAFTELLASLPTSVTQLCEIVHGLVAHRDTANQLYGIGVPVERRLEAETRYVPRDQFISAGRAWQMCRRGTADPNRFGVPTLDVMGMWFVHSNVLRDLAALNRIELLPWNYTKFCDRQFPAIDELSQDEVHLLDRVSEATGDNPVAFHRAIELYRGTLQLQVGRTIRSYTIAGPQIIVIRDPKDSRLALEESRANNSG